MKDSPSTKRVRANLLALIDRGVTSMAQLARDAGASRPTLRHTLVEGMYGITLAQGDKLAEAVGLTLPDLLKEPKEFARILSAMRKKASPRSLKANT